MEKTYVLDGHGADKEALDLYEELLESVRKKGKNAFLVMLHGQPDAEDVAEEIQKNGVSSVVLIPLLLAPGHHLEKNIISKNSEIHRKLWTAK